MASINVDVNLVPKIAAINAFLKRFKELLGKFGAEITPIDGAAFTEEVNKLLKSQKRLNTELDETPERAKNAGNALNNAFKLEGLLSLFDRVADSLGQFAQAGVDYQQSLADVGAISGVSGDKLSELGEKARGLAVDFGTGVKTQLESFTGVLGKFGPQAADNAEALQGLANNINILSETSSELTAADAMNAMTDSMLQFNLVTPDAVKNVENSTRVINVLAGAAQAGAADVPKVVAAINVAGAAAAGAGQSIETTAAAIETLATKSITGSEAGTGLRNIFGLLQKASGPAAAALGVLGTSVEETGQILNASEDGLINVAQKLKTGLDGVGSAAERNALLLNIFGTENVNAASALINNVDKMKEFKAVIDDSGSGLGSAFEQAETRMSTMQTTINRVKAFVEDFFISASEFGGEFVTVFAASLAEIGPQVTALASVTQIFPGMIPGVTSAAKAIIAKMLPALFTAEGAFVGLKNTAAGAWLAASGGKLKDIGVKVLTALLPALFTAEGAFVGMGASAASAWFAALWPIALIAAGIAGLVGGVVLLYNNFEGVRDVIDKVWNRVTAFASAVGSFFTSLFTLDFGSLGDFGDNLSAEINSADAEDLKEKIAEIGQEGVEIKAKISAQADLDSLIDELEKTNKDIATIELAVDTGNATEEQLNQLEQLKQSAREKSEAIAGVSKEAVESQAETFNKATGQFETVYKINIKQARELSKANSEIYGKGLQEAQASFTGKSKEALKVYEAQKAQLEKVKQSVIEASKAGDLDRAESLKEKYAELNSQADETRSTLVDAFKQGTAEGLLTADATEEIRLGLGLSEEDATALLEVQEELKQSATEIAEEVGSIGDEWETSFNQAKDATKGALKELNGFSLQLARLEASGASQAEINIARQKVNEQKEILEKRVEEEKFLTSIAEANEKLVKTETKKAAKQKTALEIAEKQFSAIEESSKIDSERRELTEEFLIVSERRERTTADDLAKQTRVLKTLKQQREEYVKVFQIKTDEDGKEISLIPKIKDDEQAKIVNRLREIDNEIAQEENNKLGLIAEVEIDREEFEKQAAEIEKNRLKIDIELGLAENSDLLNLLESELSQIGEKRAEIEKKISEASGDAELVRLQGQLNKVKEQELSKYKEVNSLKQEINKSQLSELESRQERERSIINEHITEIQTIVGSLDEGSVDDLEKQLQDARDARLKDLSDKLEIGVVTEEQYLSRVRDINTEHEQRVKTVRELSLNDLLDFQEAANVSSLELERLHLIERKRLLEDQGDLDAASEIGEQILEIEKEVNDKSDVMSNVFEKLKGGFTEGIQGMFSGDQSGLKEQMNKSFSTVKSFLQKMAAGAALEIVLQSQPIKATAALAGPLAPVVLAGIAAAITQGIKQLTNPVLNLLSFAESGIVGGPTVALVGDAKPTIESGSEEAILNSRMLTAAIRRAYEQIVPHFSRLESLIARGFAGLRLEARIEGTALVVALSQAQAEIDRRNPLG